MPATKPGHPLIDELIAADCRQLKAYPLSTDAINAAMEHPIIMYRVARGVEDFGRLVSPKIARNASIVVLREIYDTAVEIKARLHFAAVGLRKAGKPYE
jgi:hypothetical protein